MRDLAGVGTVLRILDKDRASVRIGTEVGVNKLYVVINFARIVSLPLEKILFSYHCIEGISDHNS